MWKLDKEIIFRRAPEEAKEVETEYRFAEESRFNWKERYVLHEGRCIPNEITW